MKLQKTLIASAIVLVALPVAVQAQKAHMATNWMAPVHILNDQTYQRWSADV